MPDSETPHFQIDRENQHDSAPKYDPTGAVHTHDLLFDDMEKMLESARPSLLRFTCTHGVTPDEASDVVQETLLEAWRSLGHLNSPERFQAWLYGICRNMCRRWVEAHQRMQRKTSPLLPGEMGASECALVEEIVDPLALDPAEVLIQQDLVTLLDRALGYLPDTTRSALELHYLAELPQKEVALRLGLTINALEVRLHRARRQLRQLLGTQLGTDAREFGLALDEDLQAGWRETRIWCMFCARHRWQGIFETFPDGREASVRFRCPLCSSSIGSPERHGELAYTGKMSELYGLRSFQVAWKRTRPVSRTFWTSVIQQRRCPYCKTRIEARLLGPDERMPSLPRWHGLTMLASCPSCDGFWSSLTSFMAFDHPQVQTFMVRYPRWIVEPEAFVEHSGHAAIRGCFVDISSAARLRIFLHAETLEVLAVFQE